MKTFTKICLSIAIISIVLGIGLLLIAMAKGFSFRRIPTYSMDDTVQGVKGLDISIDIGEVTITQGDEFCIEAENIYGKEQFKSYVSDGIWVISHRSSERYSLFGYNIPITIGIKDFNKPNIRITIPKGFKAEDIRISLDAGRLIGKNLHSETASFTVDAGSLEMEGLTVEGKSSYIVNAGQINLKRVDLKNVMAECEVGAIFMEGNIAGDNEFECNVGSIKLDIDDSMENYSFDIDSELGSVIINNKKYRSYSNTKDRSDYKGSFRLNVDVGNITMSFSE